MNATYLTNTEERLMTTTRLFLCAALSAACAGAYADAGIDTAKLTETAVAIADVSKAGQPGKAFMAATIINAPVPKLCAMIQDYAAYPNFMPNVEKVAVLRKDDASQVDMTLKLPLGKVKKYRLRMEPKVSAAQCQLSWKMLPWEGLKAEEAIADTTGYWLLVPHGADKNKTIVKYMVYTDPGPVPMGLGWIVDSMSRGSMPKTLEALRQRAAAQ
ncbi:SRPBCC family protein [Massilia violaceinigra]|nr:SRPBCC family protein [Massilia violaceinigra]